MNCPYCHKQAEFITSKQFYGRDYGTNLYVCRQCDARVGTHGKGKEPLGTMANHKLRVLRKICHGKFDPRWNYSKNRQRARSRAYGWLQKEMKLTPQEAHIGMFDEEQCRKLIKLLNKNNKNNKNNKRGE